MQQQPMSLGSSSPSQQQPMQQQYVYMQQPVSLGSMMPSQQPVQQQAMSPAQQPMQQQQMQQQQPLQTGSLRSMSPSQQPVQQQPTSLASMSPAQVQCVAVCFVVLWWVTRDAMCCNEHTASHCLASMSPAQVQRVAACCSVLQCAAVSTLHHTASRPYCLRSRKLIVSKRSSNWWVYIENLVVNWFLFGFTACAAATDEPRVYVACAGAVCCGGLQWDALCCSVLQCVVVGYSGIHCEAVSTLHESATRTCRLHRCNMLQCVSMGCSVLQ